MPNKHTWQKEDGGRGDILNPKRKSVRGANPPHHDSEETVRLIHELRERQIELETQNELLRQTQEELEAGRAKFFGFYNLAPVGFFTMNGEGLVFEANLTSTKLLGMEGNLLDGHSFAEFVAAKHQDAFYLFLKKLLLTGTPQSCEGGIKRQDGLTFWARLDATVAKEAGDGAPPVPRCDG